MGRVLVRRDVEIGHAEKNFQFLLVDKAVVETHMPFYSQVLGQPLEGEPVGFALLTHQVGMRRAEDDIDEVGKFFDHVRQGAKNILDSLIG